jgi:TetR/AcrR family transcriptional regulator, tetracycline repressor protein
MPVRKKARGRTARRGPGQRAGLDSAMILAEARVVAEREGVEQLTMRRLAERLGVAPNALYSHFADKSTLIDELLDSLLAKVEVPSGEKSWREELVALMRSTRRFLLAHDDLLPYYLSRPTRGPNAIRLGEVTLGLLERAGLKGEPAATALQILLVYTFGFAAQEAPRLADPEHDESRAASEMAFRTARNQPRMSDLAEPLSEYPGKDSFEMGLAWLLDGIEGTR